MATIRSRLLALLSLSAIVLLVVACSSSTGESADTSTPDGPGLGGGGAPPAELVQVLDGLPIFLQSDAKDTGYSRGGSTGKNLQTGSMSPLERIWTKSCPSLQRSSRRTAGRKRMRHTMKSPIRRALTRSG